MMDLSKHAVPFFRVEENGSAGSFMKHFGFLDQFAEEPRVAAIFGSQDFPSVLRCLCPWGLPLTATLQIFALGGTERSKPSIDLPFSQVPRGALLPGLCVSEQRRSPDEGASPRSKGVGHRFIPKKMPSGMYCR